MLRKSNCLNIQFNALHPLVAVYAQLLIKDSPFQGRLTEGGGARAFFCQLFQNEASQRLGRASHESNDVMIDVTL